MAGTNPQFDASAFRSGIQFAMNMGAPPIEENRATFLFESTLVYTGGVDDENVPFDPSATVVRTDLPSVRVPCAVEYYDDEGIITNFGVTQPSRVKVTLLDDDYERVAGCDRVVLGGDTYFYRRTEPPSGLFDVGLFIMHFAARQET